MQSILNYLLHEWCNTGRFLFDCSTFNLCASFHSQKLMSVYKEIIQRYLKILSAGAMLEDTGIKLQLIAKKIVFNVTD